MIEVAYDLGVTSKHVLSVFILLIAAAASSIGQTAVGGEFSYSLSTDIREPQTTTSQEARATGTILSAGDIAELEMALTITRNFVEESQLVSLDRAIVSAYPGDYLVVRGGILTYSPSVADFFPAIDFLKRTDFAQYFAGNLADSHPPIPLVQLTGFLGPGYARVTVVPVAVEVPFFEEDSIWFPNIGFPESIEVSFPSPQTLQLSEIVVDDYPSPLGTAEEVSLQAEIGGALGPVDLGLLYYHGQDMRPLYVATLEFPQGLFSDYRVRLSPVYRTVDALAATAISAVGPFRVYSEHAYRFNDQITVERVAANQTGFQTQLHESPTYTFILGGSYRLRGFLFGLEYTDLVVVDQVTRMIEPVLEHAAAASVSWREPGGRLTTTAVALLSLADYSVNTSLRLDAQTSDGSLFGSFTLPIFWGGADTELGQYSSIVYPTFSVGYRF